MVIGGYGLFGIILDIRLCVVENENLNFTRYKLNSSEYLSYFKKYATQNNDVKLVFGRLNISEKNFLEYATLNIFKSSKIKLAKPNIENQHKSTDIKIPPL